MNFNRAAADLAIRREPLARDARVHDHFKRLAAEWTLEIRKFFHVGNLTSPGQSAMAPTKARSLSVLQIAERRQPATRSNAVNSFRSGATAANRDNLRSNRISPASLFSDLPVLGNS